jgi:hypothetical protein
MSIVALIVLGDNVSKTISQVGHSVVVESAIPAGSTSGAVH